MKLFTCLLLIAISFTLETHLYNPNTQAQVKIGQIGKLTFLERELFFIGKNHQQFGYIDKFNGKVTRITSVTEGQEIIDESKGKYLLLRNQNNVLFTYNVSSKAGRKDLHFKRKNLGKIIQSLDTPNLQYILTQSQLKGLHQGQKNSELIQILASKESQKYLNIFYVSDENGQEYVTLVSLVEKEKRELCLRRLEFVKIIKEHCFLIEEKGKPQLQRSGNKVYVIFEDLTYVITKQLNIKTKITGKPIQFHQGAVITEGHQTYFTHKDAIYQYRVIESSGIDQIFMELKGEEIIIKGQQKEYGRIERKEEFEPLRSWINYEKDQDKYELVIQSSKLDLSMFTIEKNTNEEYEIKQMWTRKSTP